MAWLRKSPAERDARTQLRDATRRFKAAQSQQEADHAGADMDRADDALRAAQGKPPRLDRDEAEADRDRGDDERARMTETGARNRLPDTGPLWAASTEPEQVTRAPGRRSPDREAAD